MNFLGLKSSWSKKSTPIQLQGVIGAPPTMYFQMMQFLGVFRPFLQRSVQWEQYFNRSTKTLQILILLRSNLIESAERKKNRKKYCSLAVASHFECNTANPIKLLNTTQALGSLAFQSILFSRKSLYMYIPLFIFPVRNLIQKSNLILLCYLIVRVT